MLKYLVAGMFGLSIAFSSQAALVEVFSEDFESSLDDWTTVGNQPILTSDAFEGAQSVNTDRGFIYNDFALQAGDVISVWTKFSGEGRSYLGFGATDAGTNSFVLSSNTQDYRFQDNPDFGFTELNITTFSVLFDTWYRLEVVLGTSEVVGKVYDTDGTTLLGSLTQDVGSLGALDGGISLRTFGDSANVLDLLQVFRDDSIAVSSPAGISVFAAFCIALVFRRKS
ncbi:hypothetical protein PN836_008480 [Ningiella sp. W23]|uniref:hypothetical protein n=1 Tax=Ningiella sp. W23 TaxID=3023715 RepID=UPI0037564D04